MRDEILALDRAHVWHPYTQAGDHREPLVIRSARGSHLFDQDGRAYLDGNSSWWTAGLGHGHPRLLRALREQSEILAHCALAGITHEPAARLAAELAAVAPRGLSHVFYTDNGSGAIEVALRLALQFWQAERAPQKQRFVSLEGAFHGDTSGSASLGGVDTFRHAYGPILFETIRVDFPAADAFDRAFAAVAERIRGERDSIAGVFVEPMLQGAAGMRVYDARYLKELRALCSANDVLLIADEVFTGYGRTGRMWAVDHAGIAPDLMCVGKTFSSLLPMAATLASSHIFDAMKGTTLYYGHTFCGNPLGAAVAREVLAIFRDEHILAQVQPKVAQIASAFERMSKMPAVLRTRALGMVGALDLSAAGYGGKLGWQVYDEARKRGAYLRPLGDTVYVCPPLTITVDELATLLTIVEESVHVVTEGAQTNPSPLNRE